MVLAYKGISTIWAAPICALIVALTGGLDLIDAYTAVSYTHLFPYISFKVYLFLRESKHEDFSFLF